ncbi:hypothetical protein BD324DRAFT_647967 [Kockovaella imperatae]|uniref:NAD(P)-binding domain-containing protein n=1 Tax=Kockovaella imperatae TaxID=4999 RepID=A0A1Y1UST1_9TREE|nr:hypothetical protein BD324DRAFT_647967 [Kockovaella imperatae]ORX41070.1 hypothetical protein BD324DRAFT_647967 [Kockovaella imperatae]
MKVFLTGASGRLGTAIIPHLVARGHTVTGLVRSPESADKIERLGAIPVRGTLDDNDLLFEQARSHDAVIHCAFDGKSDRSTESDREWEIVQLFASALEGTAKRFLISSGVAAFSGDQVARTEHDALPSMGKRSDTGNAVLKLKDRGITSIVVRLATLTHDANLAHPFLGAFVKMADTFGYIPYVGDGTNRWSACNSEDAGLLYVLAMEKGEPGISVHPVQETLPFRDIAEALARRTGKTAGSITPEQAKEAGFLGGFMGRDQNISWQWTEETFDWEAKGQTLLDEIASAPEGWLP